MEQLEQVFDTKMHHFCDFCGQEDIVYAFKDKLICKACYYQT